MATAREYAQSIMSLACRIQNALDNGKDKLLTDSDVKELRKIDASLGEMADYVEEN